MSREYLKSFKMNRSNIINHKILLVTLIGIILPFIFSCSSKLNREMAEKIIIQTYQLPYDDIREINFTAETSSQFITTEKDGHDIPPKQGLLLKMEQEGLITYSINRTSSEIVEKLWWTGFGGYDTNIDYFTKKVDPSRVLKYTIRETYQHVGTLTERGKQFLVNGNNFKVSKKEFGTISGIVESQGLNITEVRYTVIETPTPFGIAVFELQNGTVEKSATFRKYDDGWRIER